MIDKKQRDWHYRIGVSCYDCERLNECPLRDNIKSADVMWCNYAAEGCVKYKGKEPMRYNMDRYTEDEKNVAGRLREMFLRGELVTLDKIILAGGTKRHCATMVYHLRQKGYEVKKIWNGKHYDYQLYGKKDESKGCD